MEAGAIPAGAKCCASVTSRIHGRIKQCLNPATAVLAGGLYCWRHHPANSSRARAEAIRLARDGVVHAARGGAFGNPAWFKAIEDAIAALDAAEAAP